MLRYALINGTLVVQVVIAPDTYVAPPGLVAVQSDSANVGDTYAGGGFTPADPVLPAAQLRVLAFSIVTILLANSRNYTIGSGVTVKCDAGTATGADLAGLNAWGLTNPTATTMWTDDFGFVTTITGTEAVSLANQVISYGQSVYNTLGTVMNEITAGTISKASQVNAVVWPT